jgi:hypothetical protein
MGSDSPPMGKASWPKIKKGVQKAPQFWALGVSLPIFEFWFEFGIHGVGVALEVRLHPSFPEFVLYEW